MSSELKDKLGKYLAKARPRFEGLEEENIDSVSNLPRMKEEFKTMALAYYSDAKHFCENGDYLNALAALEYAEGWLDAGRALGIFKNK
jgi:hypothetical protein